MFGSIGITEIMVIAGVALIFLGPEKFPEFAKIAARTVRDLRRYVDEAKRDLSEELKPVKKELNELTRYDPTEYIEKLADSAMGEDEKSKGSDADGDAGDGASEGGDSEGGAKEDGVEGGDSAGGASEDGVEGGDSEGGGYGGEAGGFGGEDFDYNLEPHPGGGYEMDPGEPEAKSGTEEPEAESGTNEGAGGVSAGSDSDGETAEDAHKPKEADPSDDLHGFGV